MPRALIVDDDLNFQLGLAEVVEREGFTAATAGAWRMRARAGAGPARRRPDRPAPARTARAWTCSTSSRATARPKSS